MHSRDGRGTNRSSVRRVPRSAARESGRSLLVLMFFICVGAGIYTNYFRPKPPPPPDASKAQASTQKKSDVVLLYTSPDCEPCDRARTWMQQRNVRFEERDVESWPPYKRELEALGSRIVPVLIINGEPQYGFLSAQVEAALRGESTAER